MAPKPLYVNGLRTGHRYFDSVAPTHLLLYKRQRQRADGGVAEAWLRMAKAPASEFRSERDWLKDVRMLRDAGDHGARALVAVKLWAPATQAKRKQWHQYSLASFLLGDPGNALYSFMPSFSARPTAGDAMVRDARVGEAMGGMFKYRGVYRRKFTAGFVMVNPTDVQRTVRVPSGLHDLSGRVVRNVVMGPNSGKILLK